ncbi:hypothetical protein D3C86_2109760 [compost metagenome]
MHQHNQLPDFFRQGHQFSKGSMHLSASAQLAVMQNLRDPAVMDQVEQKFGLESQICTIKDTLI